MIKANSYVCEYRKWMKQPKFLLKHKHSSLFTSKKFYNIRSLLSLPYSRLRDSLVKLIVNFLSEMIFHKNAKRKLNIMKCLQFN